MKKFKMYKPLTMVRVMEWYRKEMKDYAKTAYYKSFLAERHFVYMGEITNMQGHGIYAGASGKMYMGFHPENFEVIPDEEV